MSIQSMRNQTLSAKYISIILNYGSAVALLLITAVYAHQIIIASQHLFSTDFNMLYQSVRFYYAGQNIYSAVIQPLNPAQSAIIHSNSLTLFSDLNSPFLILLLLPFAYLSYGTALLLWSLISFICSIMAILLVLKSYPVVWQNTQIRWWCLAGLLIYFPFYANFCLGQISAILLLITVIAWHAYRKNHYKYAGILLGLAFSIKLFFGFFLILFIMRKQLRAFFAMLTTFVCASFIALLFFGISIFKNYLNILQHVNWYASSWNASLYGFICRIFYASQSNNDSLISKTNFPHLLFFIFTLLLLIYFTWVIYYPKKINSGYSAYQNNDAFDWQFSLTIVSVLLISPLAWLYYFTLLLIPLATIIKLMNKSAYFKYYFCALIISLILSGIPISYSSIAMAKIQLAITSGSYYFYALFLITMLLILLRKQAQNVNKSNCHQTSENQKLTFNIQILMYLLATYTSFITFAFATLKLF